jgi:hypothetical protein
MSIAKPELDMDQHWRDITTNLMVDELIEALRDRRITVMLHLPYLKDYGMPEIIYPVYGCDFQVEIGDSVLCPPTPRGDGSWNVGVVVALEGKGYAGPVKYVRKIENEE